MTDRELLALAAKAAWHVYVEHTGYDDEDDEYVTHRWIRGHNNALIKWNPLTDDGDALRLAVALRMQVYVGTHTVVAEICSDSDEPPIWQKIFIESCPYAATRRAIVCAAAEIGKDMKGVE